MSPGATARSWPDQAPAPASTIERILALTDAMFGVVTEPTRAPQKRTAMVLLNAGFIHRAGPFRLHVRLARALAAAGYPVLRFDLPGIGDTLRRAERPNSASIADVLQQLQAHTGCDRFVVGGLCSAADLGWQLALANPRVVGVIALDGLARKGLWFHAARLKTALRKSPRAWWRILRLQLEPHPDAALRRAVEDFRHWPAPGAERGQMRRLLARGVRMFALYTGATSYFLSPRQFFATYGKSARSAQVTFAYWPQCDHLFYAESDRQRLIDALCGWVTANFAD